MTIELLGTQSIQEAQLCYRMQSLSSWILPFAGIVAYSLIYHFLFLGKGGWPLPDDGIIVLYACVAASLRALRSVLATIVIKHLRRKLNGEGLLPHAAGHMRCRGTSFGLLSCSWSSFTCGSRSLLGHEISHFLLIRSIERNVQEVMHGSILVIFVFILHYLRLVSQPRLLMCAFDDGVKFPLQVRVDLHPI